MVCIAISFSNPLPWALCFHADFDVGGAESNYAFATFLQGPRSCIGEKFARAELRALIAAFVGSFGMVLANPEEKVVVGGTVTSKPVGGMKLKLKPVEWGT